MIDILLFVGGVVLLVLFVCYSMTILPMIWGAIARYVNEKVETEVNSRFEAEFRRRKTEIDSLEAEIGKKKENLEEIRGVVGKKLDRDSISSIDGFDAQPISRGFSKTRF